MNEEKLMEESNQNERTKCCENKTGLTMKLITNVAVAVIMGAAMIICVIIGVKGLAAYKQKKYEITISGYSKQQIVSDLAVWSGYYTVSASTIKEGYALLDTTKEKVLKYMLGKGVSESELEFSSIAVNEEYIWENGTRINTGFSLKQSVTISSANIDMVTDISRNATELLSEDIQFESRQPEYQYTKLEDLKVSMLADAAKDARMRAGVIAQNAGGDVGDLTSAKLSSIQITPLYAISEEIDSWGYYGYVDRDVASVEKEVTVTVKCTFEVAN